MKKKILIIEDDPDISKILRMQLTKNDYASFAAFDSITGKSMLISNPPDLIILDISLPGGNGLELAKFITNHPKLCVIPIIVITAYGTPDVKSRAEELGVIAFLQKPLDLDTLMGIINKELKTEESSN